MIGIGISTTPNRPILEETLPEWEKYLPEGARLIVENDVEYTGVAATKNRLLDRLDDCEYIFLADDDVKPLVDGWHLPYINARAKHLMYQFRLPSKPDTDMQEVYRDSRIVAYTHTRGALLFVHHKVLEVVGGLDESYGQAMYEHTDWSNRIYNAGLTPFRAMDVVNSHQLLYCYDQDGSIVSSIPDSVRRKNLIDSRWLYNKSKKSSDYKEYRK